MVPHVWGHPGLRWLRMFPGDFVSVCCEGLGQYVVVPLAPTYLPTQCDCDLCKDIRQTAAIQQHNEYHEAKCPAFFADNERVRTIHAAEREAAANSVDPKKRSRHDDVAATGLVGTAASGEIGDKGKAPCSTEQELGGNVSGTAVVGGSDCTGNAPRRALQGALTGGAS
eukprot:2541543-Rhodomonas_salina.2